MECPICFEIINNSCVASCMHHYCYDCLMKWIQYGGNNCPKCKKPFFEIYFDKEFDFINNKNVTNNKIVTRDYTIKKILNFTESCKAGITITSNMGMGVKIKKLNKNDLFYKNGFRVNDIILFINNIVCVSHEQTIKIITEANNNNKSLYIEYISIKK